MALQLTGPARRLIAVEGSPAGPAAELCRSAEEMPVSLEPFGGMMRFSIAPNLDAACVFTSESVSGEVYHVERNEAGGDTFTPVARFFAWRPVHVENFRPHWRVDCFVRIHQLSPDPKVLGDALAKGLLREAICSEPLWVSWHRSEEIHGKAFGDVFDFD